MGQEATQMVGDDEPCKTLSARTLKAVADLIKTGKAKNIVVLTGAGISTAAGIPDFRSPGTGLYNQLQHLKLPYPEAVFEIDFFRNKPEPFYLLAKALYPDNFHPTVSHAFISLLAEKGLLKMLFTQNIDTLERKAGVPDDLIVEAHGSFASQRCIDCKTEFPKDEFDKFIRHRQPAYCKNCPNSLVKPDIVFFGEALPGRFYEKHGAMKEADLVFIMGTSLKVHPFASLPGMVEEDCPRVLFNLEQVGGIGSRVDDVLALGDCDSSVRALAKELGWDRHLESYWKEIVGHEEMQKQLDRAKTVPDVSQPVQPHEDDNEQQKKEVGEEISKLAEEMAAVLLVDDETNTGGRRDRGEDLTSETAPATTARNRPLLESSDWLDATSNVKGQQDHSSNRRSPEEPFAAELNQSSKPKTMTPVVTTNQTSQSVEVLAQDSPADTISDFRQRIANLEGKSCPKTQPPAMDTSSPVETAEKVDSGTKPTREAP